MKKILVFLILTSFSFGAFSMEQVAAPAPEAQKSKIALAQEKVINFIKKIALRPAIGAGLGAVGGFATGIGPVTGMELGAGLGATSKIFGAKRGIITGLSYQYLSSPLSNFIWGTFYMDTLSRLTFENSAFLSKMWATVFQHKLFIMPTIYGTLASTIIGILAFYAIVTLISKLTNMYLDGAAIAAVEADAKNIIQRYLTKNKQTDTTWNPAKAWNEILNYKPKLTWWHPVARLGSTQKMMDQMGALIMLQFIPILACAMYKDDSLDINPNQDLAKQILTKINNIIANPASAPEGQIKEKDAWLKTLYAMMYQNCQLNIASPTAGQMVFLSGNDDLIAELISNFKNSPDVLKEFLLINKDKYGRTLMHHVAISKDDPKETKNAVNGLDVLIHIMLESSNKKINTPEKFESAKYKLLTDLLYQRWYSRVKPTLIDNQLQTPLHKAAFNLNVDFIETFFKDSKLRQISMFMQDDKGFTPLHLAFMAATELRIPEATEGWDFGEFATEEEILAEKQRLSTYTPHSRDNGLKTISVLTKDLPPHNTIKLIATQDKNGKNPLHYAAESKNAEIIQETFKVIGDQQKRVWIKRGTRLVDALKQKDKYGKTPVHAAVQSFGRYLKEYKIETIDQEIEKINARRFLSLDGPLKEQVKTIKAYINGIESNLSRDKIKTSAVLKIITAIAKIPYNLYVRLTTSRVESRKLASKEAKNFDLYNFLNRTLKDKAYLINVPEIGTDGKGFGELSNENTESLNNIIRILKAELYSLRDIKDLQKTKTLLQKHLANRFFKFKNLSYPETTEIIPNVIKALFNEHGGAGAELITKYEKFDVLKLKNEYGQTALHLAAVQDNPEDIKALIYGLDEDQILELLSIQDNLGNPALHLMVGDIVKSKEQTQISSHIVTSLFNQNTGVFKSLINDRLNDLLEIKNRNGQNILFSMIKNGYPYEDGLEHLIQAKQMNSASYFEQLSQKDKSGKTVLSLCLDRGDAFTDIMLGDLVKEENIDKFIDFLNQKDSYGRTIIHNLALEGNITEVGSLIAKLVSPKIEYKPIIQKTMETQDYAGNTPLHYFALYLRGMKDKKLIKEKIAAFNNLVHDLRQYFEDDAKVFEILTQTGATGRTLLHLAAESGCTEFVDSLINLIIENNRLTYSVHLIKKDTDGNTTLHIAAKNLDFTMINFLLMIYSNQKILAAQDVVETFIKAQNNGGNTFLHVAAQTKALPEKLDEFFGNILALDPSNLLISDEEQATQLVFDLFKIQNNEGSSVLHNLAEKEMFHANGSIKKIFKTFKQEEQMYLIQAKDNRNQNSLHIASKNGNFKFIQFMESLNLPQNFIQSRLQSLDANNQTPLLVAVANYPYFNDYENEINAITEGQNQAKISLEEIETKLKQRKFAYDQASEKYIENPTANYSPFVTAQKEYFALSNKYTTEKAQIEEIDKNLNDLLDSSKKYDDLVKKYDTTIKQLLTLVDISSAVGSSKFIDYLNHKDKQGNSALHLAAERGATQLLNMTIKQALNPAETVSFVSDGSVIEQNNNGDTPLHIAVKKGFNNFAEILIRKYVMKNQWLLKIQNKAGMTPMHIIASTDNIKLAELIFGKKENIGLVQANLEIVELLERIKTRRSLTSPFGKSVMSVAGPKVKDLLQTKLRTAKERLEKEKLATEAATRVIPTAATAAQ